MNIAVVTVIHILFCKRYGCFSIVTVGHSIKVSFIVLL
jgi:hypothetical protein